MSRRSLHILALSGFAVAQPLYDLIGRHAEFLVTHRAGPWTVLAIVGALSVAVPLVLIALERAAALAGARAQAATVVAVVALLAGVTAAGAARELHPGLAISIALATAIASALLYRLAAFRTFLTILSPAALLFPILFVTATPVSRLVWPGAREETASAFARTPPIVLVIFDELNTQSLLDANGGIDAARFPNFAALARTATWFPNALSPSPKTNHALPAILTGLLADASSGRLPIAADFPSNLFTWLGESYALHVDEPFSALCPPDRCAPAGAGSGVNARALFLDIAVLYLHLVTPQDIGETRLPALAFKWKGFAAVSEPTSDDYDPDKGFGRAMNAGRANLFRRFIGGIRTDPRPTLHFEHAVLPHSPYEFLSEGLAYPHGGHTPGLGADGWLHEPPLLETARRRHVEQLRFVDMLVGELVDALKSRGLFDEALLVVTADHGGSFKAGEPQRDLTAANYRDIVAVPMFVKLPQQRAGAIDETPVSGLDIVPTIAQALGAQVPWRIDGHPMFATDYPERRTVEYAGLRLPRLDMFDVREEARQVARSSRDSAADDPRLLGKSLSELDAGSAAIGQYVGSDSFRAFQSVALKSGTVPALVNGVITHDTPPVQPVDLAIAVNGIVQATTRTARWRRNDHYFSALVPGAAFRDGVNRLEVLAIETGTGGTRLRAIAPVLPPDFRMVSGAAGEELRASDGTVLTVAPHIVGNIDRVVESAESVRLLGWAVDPKQSRQLRALAAFSEGAAVSFAFPDGDRADVVAALGLTRSVPVAFELDIARKDLRHGGVRVFGIGFDNVAGELQLGEQPRRVLGR